MGIGGKASAATPVSQKPNVIFILADDMAIGDISYYNHGITDTSNIDKLIEDGVVFSQAYSSAPVSAPARASLLTGLYPHATGCVTLNLQRYPELTRIKKSVPTLADVFRDNGYVTGLVGKWHCGIGEGYHPLDRGFDVFEGYHGFDLKTYNDYYINIGKKKKRVTNLYLTDDLSERAIQFVRKYKDRPFFLHLAHSAPHVPLGAPEEVIKKYLDKGIDRDVATIYAMVEVMDRGIGELVQELKQLDLWENTIVVFSSDNGPDPSFKGRYNMEHKGAKYTVNEGGIHVPFVLTWGDVYKKKVDSLIHFTDVLPTLVELCQLNDTIIDKRDGISFANYIVNKKENAAGLFPHFWQWNRGVPFYSHNAAVRLGEWKLVRPYITNSLVFEESVQRPELYHIQKDPAESVDVSDDNPIIYNNLRVLLEQWSREVENRRLNY